MKKLMQGVGAAVCLGLNGIAPPGAASEATLGPVAPEPAVMHVDAEAQRVYVPDRGWMSAEAFWDLYYNHPQELPGGMDFDALETVRAAGDAPRPQ